MKTTSVKTGEPVYILQNFLGSTLAVYSTFHALSDGVDYWVDIMKEYSDENRTLFWFEFKMDYHPEAMSFDYAYIDPDRYEATKSIGIENGICPEFFDTFFSKKNAGKNLIPLLLERQEMNSLHDKDSRSGIR